MGGEILDFPFGRRQGDDIDEAMAFVGGYGLPETRPTFTETANHYIMDNKERFSVWLVYRRITK